MIVVMSPCERGCFSCGVCRHECVIGYALLCVLVLASCQMCINMVVVVMHEVMVCVVDMVMH